MIGIIILAITQGGDQPERKQAQQMHIKDYLKNKKITWFHIKPYW